MERSLTFSTTTKIPCICTDSAPVLLKVTSALITPTDCPNTAGTYTNDFIQATLEYADYSTNSQCETLYSYTVKYDDSVLVSYDEETEQADPPLYSADILGIICDDVLADWVRQQNGVPIELTQDPETGIITLVNQYGCSYDIDIEFNLVLIADDTNTVDLTLAGSTLTADVILNPDADNLITAEADGLKVLALDVTDTNSINLTESVTTSQQTLSADVKISANADNQVSIEADGLYVPEPLDISILDSTSINFSIALGVISGDVIISPDVGNILTSEANGLKVAGVDTFNDTNSIDFDRTNNVISADVNISPDAGNIISVLANGLFASASILTSDTSSIAHTFAANTLSSTIKLSADADNILTIEADGLKSDAINAVTDTTTVDLTKTDNDLQADVIISPAGGNILQANGDGLFVPGAAAVGVDDTNSIDLTLTGGTITGDVNISADVDNTLTIEADGLKAITVVQVSDTNSVDMSVAGNDTVSAAVRRDPAVANILEEDVNGLYVSINTILEAVYPVGAIIESYVSTNPASYATPYPGTWVAIGTGQTTIGVNPADSTANTPGEVSGAETVNLNHNHIIPVGWDSSGVYLYSNASQVPVYGSPVFAGVDHHYLPYTGIAGHTFGNGQIRVANTQGSLGNVSVRQPSVAVYRWRRTA